MFQFFITNPQNSALLYSDNQKSQEGNTVGHLEVGDHLVEVLVDLGQLAGELLVLEGVALLVEDLGHGGDQQQPLLGVSFGEADGLDGLARGQLQGGARGLLASQVPERFFLEELSFGSNHSHGRDEEERLEGGVGLGVEILCVAKQP